MRASVAAVWLSMAASVALSQQPRIDSISPGQGPIAGGTAVTMTGISLQGATVTVDKIPAALTAMSSTEIHFTTQPHDNGIATIKVSTGAGNAYTEFLYVPPALKDLPPGYITTVAGIGEFSGAYRPATRAEVQPVGIAFNRQGNLFVAEPEKRRVSRVSLDGILEPFAGTGVEASNGDGGPATEAAVGEPRSVTLDSDGNAYIGDAGSNTIRRVDAQTGVITSIAGNGRAGFGGDGGPATLAMLDGPSHLAGDGHGTVFFIDCNNSRVRRVTPDGIITTVAGTGVVGFSGDGGPATEARFDVRSCDFGALAYDPRGYLYLADSGNSRVRRIDLQSGIITTIAGPTNSDGTPLADLYAVAVDSAGNIYYSGTSSPRIRKISSTGEPLGGFGSGFGFSQDGSSLTNVPLGHISGLTIDTAGSPVYSDFDYRRVRRLNLATGKLETLAGIGPGVIGDNGPAIAATLSNYDGDLAFLPTGELLIGDAYHFLLRKIDAAGNISTVAGNGSLFAPLNDDVFATEGVVVPVFVEVDHAGNIYAMDADFTVVRIDPAGILHRFAGAHTTAGCGYAGDGGLASEASLCQPWDVAVDEGGNVYIADTNNNRIRRIDSGGVITTIAGNGGPVNGFENYLHGTFCGDGGPALEACLNTPYGVAVDRDGNLFVADEGNMRIRRIDPTGTVTTVATQHATKLVVDGAGYIYYTGSGAERCDRFGVVTTIAGTGAQGFSGDGGPALQAATRAFGQAEGIAIDEEGNIFINDGRNQRVRAIRYGAVLAPPDATIQATASGSLIRATVFDAAGRPAPGVRVDFDVPAGGASCKPSKSFAITDGNGVAGVTCTPNCIGGAYRVTARPMAASSFAMVSLMNVSRPCRRRSVWH